MIVRIIKAIIMSQQLKWWSDNGVGLAYMRSMVRISLNSKFWKNYWKKKPGSIGWRFPIEPAVSSGSKQPNLLAALYGEPNQHEHRFAAGPVRPAGPNRFLKHCVAECVWVSILLAKLYHYVGEIWSFVSCKIPFTQYLI